MQCRRCGFENTPDQRRCFRCGTILVADATVAILPPRMARWKRPLRRLSRAIRLLSGDRFDLYKGSEGPAAPRTRRRTIRLDRYSSWLAEMAIGLIPGLPYLINGQVRQVWPLLLAWLAFVGIGALCYATAVGFVALGLAIAIHAWLIIRRRIWATLKTVPERLVTTILLAVLLFILYLLVRPLVAPDISFVRTRISIPAMQIFEGDVLVVRSPARIPVRGMLVVVRQAAVGFDQTTGQTIRLPGTGLGQVIGLPGELVELHSDRFRVNGVELDTSKYPVPQRLKGLHLSTRLGHGQYFIALNYHSDIIADNPSLTANTCTVEGGRITGNVFMRWWPLWRRGRIGLD